MLIWMPAGSNPGWSEVPWPAFAGDMLLQIWLAGSQIVRNCKQRDFGLCRAGLQADARIIPPGNGPLRTVHLISAKVKCVSVLLVDLGLNRWYQKFDGLVGVLLNSWARA